MNVCKITTSYIKITSDVAVTGLHNTALKTVITFIGKRYGKLADKKDCTSKEYFKAGKKFIAKNCKCGSLFKTAIDYMVSPRKIRGEESVRQWCYSKRKYAKAYWYIIKLLLNCQPEDKEYVAKLLNALYIKASEDESGLAYICSNALILHQKNMLRMCRVNDKRFSKTDRELAGNMVEIIEKIDKPIPHTT